MIKLYTSETKQKSMLNPWLESMQKAKIEARLIPGHARSMHLRSAYSVASLSSSSSHTARTTSLPSRVLALHIVRIPAHNWRRLSSNADKSRPSSRFKFAITRNRPHKNNSALKHALSNTLSQHALSKAPWKWTPPSGRWRYLIARRPGQLSQIEKD